EAASVLRPLADLAAPVRAGADVPFDQLVRAGEHDAQRAADCPASIAHEGEFPGWRTAMAGGRVGLAVLERMRKPGAPPPGAAARQLLDDWVAGGRDSLSQWLAELGPGGRATVVRDAVGFAIAARAALDASWPPAEGTRFVEVPFRWNVPGRAVRLEAKAQSVLVRGGARWVLLLGRGELDEQRLRNAVAWIALVSTLGTGVVPRAIARYDLDAGDRRSFPVTDDVLDAGLTLAASTVAAAIAARYTEPASPVPGGWCRTCRGREICPVAR
ncbi:MAG TPA: hypothetical protein VEA78_10435, partial [Acidimicrobiales bacterium]|nr:hypothetical protein [Acidimicrobiales bacterium]